MPPKPRKHEGKGAETTVEEDPEYSVSSPASIASGSSASSASTSMASCMTMTTEQFQQLLDCNSRNMLAILERTPPASASPLGGALGTGHDRPKFTPIPVPKWAGDDTPWEYFSKYEVAQKHNGVPKEQWGPLLQVYLSGKAQAALAQLDLDNLEDFDLVKSTMLRALGDTPEEADRQWWTLKRKKFESIGAFYLRMKTTSNRRFQGVASIEEMADKVLLSRFMSLLPAECYSAVSARHPKTGKEAAEMVHDFECRQDFSRSYLSGDSTAGQNRGGGQYYKREHGSGYVSNNLQGSSSPSPKTNGSGSNPAGSTNSSQNAPSSGSEKGYVQKENKGWKKRDWTDITCHGCGVKGHIKPNCPNKVRRVSSPSTSSVTSSDSVITAWLGGRETSQARIDLGADRTIVHKDYIPLGAYVEGTVELAPYSGSVTRTHKLAVITIKVGPMEETAKVAVDGDLECAALLGDDLSRKMKSYLLGVVKDKIDKQIDEMAAQKESHDSGSIRRTRAQVKKDKEQEEADEIISQSSDCKPVPLGDIFQFGDELFESEPTPTALEDLSAWPTENNLDLPVLEVTVGDCSKLISEQQADSSLTQAVQAAGKEELGYSFEEGVVVHNTTIGLEEEVKRIVVPTDRRQKVLVAAHSDLVAGHFGYKKTLARIARYFMWPGIWKDVRAFVKTCGGCQRAAKKDSSKAPLQPLPIVSEPFGKIAFDLVGPLPRSSSGYRYLLTMICLYTKFPVAVPLKRVDNITVLDAMMEVFSNYGFPKVILTDQGSVFTSKLTREMCKSFSIEKVRTSPYHPQSDGALERWHACLKGMFKKADTDIKNWDSQVKYLLLAYRDTPHCVTGFSPFSLMFGREAGGPLQQLRTSWLEDKVDDSAVHEWLLSVKTQMTEMAQLVSDRESKAKASMKAFYDRSAKEKTFEPGDMVIVRNPVLKGKMGDSWEGPYQVEKKASPVTYIIQRPGHASRTKVIHANLLRKWHTPISKIHRVAFIQEEEGESESTPGLVLVREDFEPTEQEQSELDEVLVKHKHVLSKDPGRTDLLTLSINTGSHEPVRSCPYRIPPKWQEEVKAQLDQLLSMGIIRPSSSPWASSVVTVRKKDGGIRICVDYRAINSCTEPDPYLMPLIEEILDTLAPAAFISKIDLNKGFHQIPVNPDHIQKTAFCTPWGKFEFVVMPFGVRNGPAVFQRLMDGLLHRDLDISRVYIDDIAVFSPTWKQHCKDIARVLDRLGEAGLTANVSKCLWGQTSCEFLGHIVGKGKVSPAELKVKVVQEFQFPKTKKHVRQFLGLTGYYRRFVPHYSEHTFHLTETTKKSAPDCVRRTNELLSEFEYLKEHLCNMPSLTLPLPSDSYLLQTDASGVGLGAVLSVCRGDQELPVAFHSRKLKERERRYSASELEGLAVVDAVQHFGAYLIPQSFTIETDHRALVYLQTAKHQNGRLARWALALQPYSYTIRYRAGSLNENADALSRLCGEEEEPSSLHPSPLDLIEGGGRCQDLTHRIPRRPDSYATAAEAKP